MENQNVATNNPQGESIPASNALQPIPNATGVLVLGIISIPTCFCYGIVGMICGIIALVMSGKATKIYNSNPGLYSQTSYKNLKAGRTCAIIGTILSGIYLLFVIIYIIWIVAILGGAFSLMPWQEILDNM